MKKIYRYLFLFFVVAVFLVCSSTTVFATAQVEQQDSVIKVTIPTPNQNIAVTWGDSYNDVVRKITPDIDDVTTTLDNRIGATFNNGSLDRGLVEDQITGSDYYYFDYTANAHKLWCGITLVFDNSIFRGSVNTIDYMWVENFLVNMYTQDFSIFQMRYGIVADDPEGFSYHANYSKWFTPRVSAIRGNARYYYDIGDVAKNTQLFGDEVQGEQCFTVDIIFSYAQSTIQNNRVSFGVEPNDYAVVLYGVELDPDAVYPPGFDNPIYGNPNIGGLDDYNDISNQSSTESLKAQTAIQRLYSNFTNSFSDVAYGINLVTGLYDDIIVQMPFVESLVWILLFLGLCAFVYGFSMRGK